MTPEQKEIHKLRYRLAEMVDAADALIAAIDGTTDQFDHLTNRLEQSTRFAEAELQAGVA